MPPKKGKKGKKGKGAAGDGGELDPAADVIRLKRENDSLRAQLAMRTQDALAAERQKREVRSRFDELRQDFRENESQTLAITADMTRQYKAMEEGYLRDINKLQQDKQALRDELAEARVAYEELKMEKDSLEKAKNEEIGALREKMEEMAEEFAEMLGNLLHKMSEKIEVPTAKWEENAAVPMLQRAQGAAAGGAGGGLQ